MTRQVRKSYRNHRKTAWGLALAVTAALAALVIPIASGASEKTFKLAVSSPVCNGGSVTVTIENTAKTQTLGSIEVYFPNNTVNTTSLGTETVDSTQDPIRIDNLNLAKGASRSFTVTLNSGTFTAQVTAVGKQSNQFNDTQGGANLFEHEGSFPTLRVVTCVTVSGRVYQDRNLDNTYTTGSGAFLNSDIPKAWSVKLFAKDVGASSYPSTPFKTVTSQSASGPDPGAYTFTQVPTGSDYKICVTALGADASSKWGLQSPTGNTQCAAISTGGPTTAANQLPNLSANASGQDFQVVPVVGPFGASTNPSTVGGYTVDASSNSTKADDFYVQDVWVDSVGRTNFRFSPINQCTPPNCPAGTIYLLETLTADIELSDLEGQQASLNYDDAPPFLDADLKPMPYCLIDPRLSGGALATSGVLGTNSDGSPATSCIVEASQDVVANGNVRAVYNVYTSYDGGRQVG